MLCKIFLFLRIELRQLSQKFLAGFGIADRRIARNDLENACCAFGEGGKNGGLGPGTFQILFGNLCQRRNFGRSTDFAQCEGELITDAD